MGSPASLRCSTVFQSANRSGCSKFSRMWSQGANPRRTRASRSDNVPVRPNPAPMTWSEGAAIPAGRVVSVMSAPLLLTPWHHRWQVRGVQEHELTTAHLWFDETEMTDAGGKRPYLAMSTTQASPKLGVLAIEPKRCAGGGLRGRDGTTVRRAIPDLAHAARNHDERSAYLV